MPERPITPELAGRTIDVGIDEHFSYWKEPLYAERTGQLLHIFKEMREMGITKHRYDFKWEDIQPKRGETDVHHLTRLRHIADLAKQAGLENAIVLSHPPKWALNLAKKDPRAFVAEFANYVDTVLGALAGDGKSLIIPSSIQIFNELNVPIYTIKEVSARIPECVDIVRTKSFDKFGKKIPLMTTINVTSPLVKGINFPSADPVEFIKHHAELLNHFDDIGLDYYPGIWHMPPETAKLYWENRHYFLDVFKYRNDPDRIKALTTQPHIDMFRKIFGNMELLEKTIQELKPLGKKLVISEIGAPTVLALDRSKMLEDHEKWQELAVRAMALGLSETMAANDIHDAYLYCLTNKPSTKPPPDSEGPLEWGWMRDTGVQKQILKSKSIRRIMDIFRHPINRTDAPSSE